MLFAVIPEPAEGACCNEAMRYCGGGSFDESANKGLRSTRGLGRSNTQMEPTEAKREGKGCQTTKSLLQNQAFDRCKLLDEFKFYRYLLKRPFQVTNVNYVSKLWFLRYLSKLPLKVLFLSYLLMLPFDVLFQSYPFPSYLVELPFTITVVTF